MREGVIPNDVVHRRRFDIMFQLSFDSCLLYPLIRYHPGTILGLSWDYPGTILGLSWDYPGIVLTTSPMRSWAVFGQAWGRSRGPPDQPSSDKTQNPVGVKIHAHGEALVVLA